MTTISNIRIRRLSASPAHTAKGEIARDGVVGLEYVGDLWGRVEYQGRQVAHESTPAGRRFVVAISDRGPLKDVYGLGVTRHTVVLSDDIELAHRQAREVLKLAMQEASETPAGWRALLTALAAIKRARA